MKHGMAQKAAQSKLDKQIEVLAELRNAGTRAVEFREWRQTTLTLIERIWPDQSARATRFRRIPFSPSSASADDHTMREAFERGCAEARRLLKLWQAEVGHRGVTQEAEAPRLAEAVRQTLVEMQPPPRPPSLPAPEAGPRQPPPPGPRQPAAPPQRARVEAKPGAKPTRKPRKEQLGEMLGFTRDVSPEGGPELPPEFEPASGAGEGGRDAAARDLLADALAQSIDHALEHARQESKGLRHPDEPIDSKGRTYETVPVEQSRTLVSYVARAFIGLASDLGELGVPDGHQERVRLALLDLANHIDCGSVTWALLRDAVTLVMHYPALGRQALPLLLPYLENAA